MKLTRWQHGLLSFLILIGLVVLVIAALIRPAVSYYKEKQEELVTQQDRLQKYRAVAAQKDTLTPYYEKQISRNSDSQNFLPIMAPSLAAAKLQEQIKSLLKGNQGQLISTQPVATQNEDFFTPVIVRIRMKSDVGTLLNVLHNLESNQPLAFIDNLQIQRTGSNRNNASRRSAVQNINPLNTSFDLKVYMLNEDGEPNSHEQ